MAQLRITGFFKQPNENDTADADDAPLYTETEQMIDRLV